MNILPKKRWHVRNRENIARVRKDELAAQTEEKEKERRKRIAEQEAKLEILRSKSEQKSESPSSSKQHRQCEHINFFEGVEASTKNEEHEREIKEEKEKYEKQIGYLTYLGQNTNEADGRISWYNKPRNEMNYFIKDGDKKDKRSKLMLDPLKKIEFVLHKKSTTIECEKVDQIFRKEQKSGPRHSSTAEVKRRTDKKSQLATLREKRLKREREEKKRIEKLLFEVKGEKPVSPTGDEEKSLKRFSRRYNSQFNPHLARQNFTE